MRPYATLVVALLLGACRSEVAFVPPPPCEGAIHVMFGGTAPSGISWVPNCGITHLTVRHESATIEPDPWMWSFTVPENAPVGPTLVYGKAPQHATVFVEPKPLTPGEVYTVTVSYVVGGDVVAATGTTSFKWYPAD